MIIIVPSIAPTLGAVFRVECAPTSPRPLPRSLVSRRELLTATSPAALLGVPHPASASYNIKTGRKEVSLVNTTFALIAGTTAIATGVDGRRRSELEKKMGREMVEAQTTVSELRTKAEAGLPLPDVCMIKGLLRADGAPVRPLCGQVPSLRKLFGRLEPPPENIWLKAAKNYGRLTGRIKREKGAASDGQMSWWRFQELVEKTTGITPDMVSFAATGTSGNMIALDPLNLNVNRPGLHPERPCLVTELLVQRLSVHAYKRKKKKSGDVTKRIPRAFSYNAHHARQSSKGLFVIGQAGEEARIRLPDFKYRTGVPPPLFLPVADVFGEFRNNYLENLLGLQLLGKRSAKRLKQDPLTTPFTFVSRFLGVDLQSATDDGSSFRGAPASRHVLDELASISPSTEWAWNPEGFYDKAAYAPSEARACRALSYAQLKARVAQAPRLNKDRTRYAPVRSRDAEFGWRVSELAVPANIELWVLGKPVYDPSSNKDRPIVLVDPFDENADGVLDDLELAARDKSAWRLDMAFLSASADELIVQRTSSANAYIGLAVAGVSYTLYTLNEIADVTRGVAQLVVF